MELKLQPLKSSPCSAGAGFSERQHNKADSTSVGKTTIAASKDKTITAGVKKTSFLATSFWLPLLAELKMNSLAKQKHV